MDYRREIDGLRAIAVLPVIFFHAGFEAFSGGFVGVDVFFVISGYLITSIILSELEQGKFSIVNFYERRARRILPALFLVMLVCMPFAWFWLLPGDMKDFSQSLIAVSVFSSNILFWRESGYFDAAAELKPLLHTWSLAVEEQYYVLFPLFLMLFWKLGKRWILLVLGLVFFASLGVAQWAANAKPAAAFYLLPTRGWELLIGAFAAFYLSSTLRKDLGKELNEAGGWLGLALISYSVFSYSKATPFPGFYALVPTIGTVLVILFATQETSVGKFIGNKFFVEVGLVSYSAYLWHHPVFAFARHRSLFEPSEFVFGALAGLVFILAYFSWKYIETPFRKGVFSSRSYVYAFSVMLSIICVAALSFGYWLNEHKLRINQDVVALSKPVGGAIDSCVWDNYDDPCMLGDKSAIATLAILGDSHTNVLKRAFSERFSSQNILMLSYGGSWCAPLLDFGTSHRFKNPICRDYMNNSVREIIANPDIETVILHAEWSNYTKGFRWGDPGIAFYTDSYTTKPSLNENISAVNRGLKRTIQSLLEANKSIIIVKSVPEYEVVVPVFLAKNYFLNNEIGLDSYSLTADDYRRRNIEIEAIFKEYEDNSKVSFVEPINAFCSNKLECDFVKGRNSLYTDGNHLSYHGALILVEEISHELEKLDR